MDCQHGLITAHEVSVLPLTLPTEYADHRWKGSRHRFLILIQKRLTMKLKMQSAAQKANLSFSQYVVMEAGSVGFGWNQ